MESPDAVTVLRTEDAGLLAVAKSLLEAEGIPCVEAGEELGQAVTGSNPIAGPTELLVPPDREEEARALLAQHIEGPPSDED